MKTCIVKEKRLCFFKAAIVLFLLLVSALLFPFSSTFKTASAEVREDDLIKIESYDVEMTIGADRQVRVNERITVKFLKSTYQGEKLTMFYRSLPIEQARYYDISAACEGNDEFRFEVANNPSMDGFFDINCIGGVEKDAVWTYDIAFTMENGKNAASSDNGMIIDVIPFGFTVDLHNVTATVHFPYAVSMENCKTYVGYGSTTNADLNKKLSDDGKTLTFEADVLGVSYNESFDEYVAKGVSLDFVMDGEFDGYFQTRFFTTGIWVLLVVGLVCAAGAVFIRIATKSRREMVTVVNVKAPDDMDPMKMGKILDGNVDNEDVTSMIYYFAHKGYLTIDLQDEDDPKFTKKVDDLPDSEAIHAKTLFKGLFRSGEEVYVSDLKNRFYRAVDKASAQVSSPKMYEGKSLFGYFAGGILGVLFALLAGLFFGLVRLGGGYTSFENIAFGIPVVAILVMGFLCENYRYKWKKAALLGMRLGQLAIAVLFSLLFLFFFPNHVMTEFEKLVVCVGAFVPTFATLGSLSRTEEYQRILGEILGFKEFIVVTEEEKIKFMLQENPELYYKILPYAQVLGVTNEWEKKFANILIKPPQWCTGTSMTVFDYMLLNRCMHVAMVSAMTRPQSSGGGSIGRSGGGGSFGGFGGGGFGGGGGGAR